MNEAAHIADLQHRIATTGDQDAYKELFLRFQPLLKKFAYTICHSREGAEEVVSDVFMRIWVKRKTLDHIQNLKLYLYIATRNFSLNYLRARQRHSTLQLEELKVDTIALGDDPHEHLLSVEMQQRIAMAVNDLPPQCKIVFKLVKEDGLRQREVAELLHLTPKTVENQLAIAVKRIGKAVLSGNDRVPKQ